MSTLLVLRTSINGAQSASNRLLDTFISKTLAKWPDTHMVERDLNTNPVPMLDSHTVAAIRAGVADSEAQRNAIALADELVAEIQAADYIAIGLPRYNFTAAATFKSYVDYLARAGITFRYGANGPEGLLPNIPVYGFITSGGEYADNKHDPMSSWIKQILGFMGLHNVQWIHAEGLAYAADAAMAKAEKRIDEIIAC